MSTRAYMAALVVPFVLLTSVRSLRFLAPVSLLANVLQSVAIGIIFYFLIKEVKPVENRLYVAPVSDWPIFLGIAVFSFESIGIVSL
jgi:proton-coupled amino acid transporter